MIILAYTFSGLSLLMGVLFFIHLKSPLGWIVLFAKLAAGALSPVWAVIGLVGSIIGWGYQAFWAILPGILGACMSIWYIWCCTRDHKGFEDAFGSNWSDRISSESARHMVKKRWTWYLNMKTSPEPTFERDVVFWTIPGTDRQLLCDIWRPDDGKVSGLAFVYFHGGAWFIWDKDTFTRPFFRHLVAQGHTVMDVSYRLCPEVDIYGMIADVKRAIAWMKVNAPCYGVDPEKIIIGGSSAGGHLALLAGYTPEHPALTPDDLINTDVSVCGIISHYGPKDLLVLYSYMNLHRTVGLPSLPIGKPLKPNERFGYSGRLDILLGGHPQEALSTYQLASPISHVQPGCPPTLLIQGNHDVVCSMDTTRALNKKLVESGVPVVNVVFPSTAHGFDLLLPWINPPAQSALYDVDRFLALMVNKG